MKFKWKATKNKKRRLKLKIAKSRTIVFKWIVCKGKMRALIINHLQNSQMKNII